MDACLHIDQIASDVMPSGGSCQPCVDTGSPWAHLRLCMSCGAVRCCDDSPNRHARAHAAAAGHPVIRSFEPGEVWWYCFVDDLVLARRDGWPPARGVRRLA